MRHRVSALSSVLLSVALAQARRLRATSTATLFTLLVAVCIASPADAFTQVFPPFSSGSDFATGFFTCPAGFGPIGVLFDGTHFFATDGCNLTTYRFTPAGGDTSTADAVSANGLGGGLALSSGVYYGVHRDGPLAGLHILNPNTLGTTLVASVPATAIGVAADPLTTDIYVVSQSTGIYRVQNPTSASPTTTLFVSGVFDGIYFSPDGSILYAPFPGRALVGFNRSGTQTVSINTGNLDDGIAIAQSNTIINGINVSNNLFVNGNDGTIVRIDVNNGNAASVVATGGSRGDFMTVSPDHCLYVTQSDRIEKMSPCFFEPTNAPAATQTIPSGIGPAAGTVNPQAAAAEPVSTGNGNYYYQHTDFGIPARGLPLIFTRSYNTLDNYAGPLGANWTHTYNIILTPTASGATIKWGDGHGETYTLTGGVYVPQPGIFSALVRNGDGTYTLTTKDQVRFLFSSGGQLLNITDRNGNALVLTYTGAKLTNITDTAGRILGFTYDASGRITQITDPIGRTVTFSYDPSNELIKTIDPAAGVYAYAYDSAHRVTSITLPNSHLLLQNTYDSQGRVASQTNGRGFTWTFAYGSPGVGQTTIIDALGNKTVHTYDSSLRIIQIADALGGTVRYTYDANNDRTSVTNQAGKTTALTYDAHGNVASVTDPLGDVSTFTYDAKNDLLTSTDPRGQTFNFSYDTNGNLILVKDPLANTTSFTYDSFGEATSTTDATGATATLAYDSSGNLASFADPLGDATNSAHDGLGRLTSVTDPTGQTWTSGYDALDRLTAKTDPLGNKTQYSYDPVGNLVAVNDANNHTTLYSYDPVNDLIAVTDALGHLTRYAYDGGDNRISSTHANGNTDSYAYDALNRLIRVTDPLGFVATYSYDVVGNLASTTDAEGQTNVFSHDAVNRLAGISYADGSKVAYSYDADGNRTTMTDSHGTTAYTYDALDRLTSATFPGGNTVGYSYNAVGERQSLAYPDGRVVNYTYDLAHRLANVTDWLGQKASYTYDTDSNLRAVSYPNGAGLSFSYDTANRLVQVLNNYGPGLATAFPATTHLTYALDPVGNRSQVTDAVGNTTNFTYDAVNELLSASGSAHTSSYTYDPDGNRLTADIDARSVNYTYDEDDRLLTATSADPPAAGAPALRRPRHHQRHSATVLDGNAAVTTFTYDADGNRITEVSDAGPVTYAYDAANRLTVVSERGEVTKFAYDGDGNRTGQGLYTYVNDVATALPVVLHESGPNGDIDYTYGLGRIAEATALADYFYQYDGLGSAVGLTDPHGQLATAYSYDPWGNGSPFPPNKTGSANKFRFTGEALDPGTGLYYLRARYYDPSVGRFLTSDPLRGSAEFPLSRNRYVYAYNSPERFADPSGDQVGIEIPFWPDPLEGLLRWLSPPPPPPTIELAPSQSVSGGRTQSSQSPATTIVVRTVTNPVVEKIIEITEVLVHLIPIPIEGILVLAPMPQAAPAAARAPAAYRPAEPSTSTGGSMGVMLGK